MAWAVILVVVAAWGAFLLPEVIGSRRSAPLTTTQEFDRWTTRVASVQTENLGNDALNRKRVLTRRRRTLALLIGAAVATLGVAIWQGAPHMLTVHIVIDGAIAWYLAMLVQLRHRKTALAVVTPVRPVSDGVQEIPSTSDVHVIASG